MCGIAGIFNGGDREALNRMFVTQKHRGPDDQDMRWWHDEHVGLSHRRLSILDLSAAGRQPMRSSRSGLWIVFNGEIYNYHDVKEELLRHGIQFQSNTDTEVILRAYEIWGEKCLQRLNGMFAFAIYHPEQKSLFVARDRLGVKPLYYTYKNKMLLFASEIKSIIASRLVPLEINEKALKLYLSLQYVPSPETLFRGINKLPPGHYLTINENELEIKKYWSAPYFDEFEDKGIEQHSREFRELFTDAVSIRMVSDVPIGAFLSGGIDSSIVVSEMAKLSAQPVQTYSVGFKDSSKHYDELEYAEAVAEMYKTNHKTVICNSNEAKSRIPELVYYLDEPVNETLIYPFNKVSQLAKETASVVLTGEGADEFLLGYRYYSVLHQYEPYFDLLPKSMRNVINLGLHQFDNVNNSKLRIMSALLRGTTTERAIQWGTFFNKKELATMVANGDDFDLHEYFANSVPSELNSKLIPSYLDHKYRMVDYILMRSDKMSMQTALECRSPFLDYRVVEYMVRLPLAYKNPGGVSKYLLRHAYKDQLPKVIVERRKKPFAAPIHAWLLELSKTYLLDSQLVNDHVVNANGLAMYLKFDKKGRAINPAKLWLLLMLEIWYRIYFKNSLNKF